MFPIYFNAILPRTLTIIANMQTIYRLIHREEFMHPFSLEALLQNTVLLQFREKYILLMRTLFRV